MDSPWERVYATHEAVNRFAGSGTTWPPRRRALARNRGSRIPDRNPFKLELQHFGECIRTGGQPLTPGREAIADIALVGDIVKAYLHR